MYNKRTRHDYFFYQMALDNMSKLYQLLNQKGDSKTIRDSFLEKIEKIRRNELPPEAITEIQNSDELKAFISRSFSLRMYATQTILNSAFCLESFINDYGAAKLGSRYFESHLDKLDVKSKWLVIPRLATNKSIEKGGHGYETLKKTIGIRNKLVHSKSKNIDDGSIAESAGFKETVDQMKHVSKCFLGIKVIISELESIDPSYEPLSTYKKTKEDEIKFETFYSTILSKSKPKKEGE